MRHKVLRLYHRAGAGRKGAGQRGRGASSSRMEPPPLSPLHLRRSRTGRL